MATNRGTLNSSHAHDLSRFLEAPDMTIRFH